MHLEEFHKGKEMKAIGKNVVITRAEPEATSAGGIIYTDNNKAILGTVVSIGDEVKTLSAGDSIIVNWNAAIPVKLDSGMFYITSVDNIFAVI